MAGAREVQVPRQASRFMMAAAVADGQRVGAGLEQDGVVVGAGIGVELEDRVAQAAAAQAAVGEGRRREGRGDTARLQEFKMQEAPGGRPAPAAAAPGTPPGEGVLRPLG